MQRVRIVAEVIDITSGDVTETQTWEANLSTTRQDGDPTNTPKVANVEVVAATANGILTDARYRERPGRYTTVANNFEMDGWRDFLDILIARLREADTLPLATE